MDTVSHDELLADVLASAMIRTKAALGDLRAAPASDATNAGGLDLASPTAVTGPVTKVRYEATTARIANLPMARDLVDVKAGAALLADDPNTPATETAFRPAMAHVATGYAADVTTSTALAKIDQSRDGASQPRISVSSSVKARN